MVSKTMWLRGIQIDMAAMRANAQDDFKEATNEITRKWKEGFAILKVENDRLQKEARDKLHAELARIAATEKQLRAQPPPAEKGVGY